MQALNNQHFPTTRWAAAAMLLLVSGGCQTPGSVGDGPTASNRPAWTQLVSFNSQNEQLAEQWDEWGSQHLKSGDIIFILGDSRVLFGLVNFSKFSQEIAASDFSHLGIVSIEDGKPWVYDIVTGGPRRKPLGWYLTKTPVQHLAFRRPRPELASQIPGVIEFCQRVYAEKTPFDERLVWGDDKYYCCEFVEVAFREQGIPLSQLMPISQLPNIDEFSTTLARLVKATMSITPDQEAIFPGNDSYGIWSSPQLTLLLPQQSPKQVPTGRGVPGTVACSHFTDTPSDDQASGLQGIREAGPNVASPGNLRGL